MESALWTVDWEGMFTPTRSVLEMILRATIMYFVIVALLKVVVKRQTGGVGRTDILVIVLSPTSPVPALPPTMSRSSKVRCWSRRCCSGAMRSNI